MSYKPGDFFLSVIDFFGILIPGAVFLLLEYEQVAGFYSCELASILSSVPWAIALLGAYVMGQVLFALGVALNVVYTRVMSRWWPKLACGTDMNLTFNRAFSYVRLNSAVALPEVERQAGAYKLFRTLTVVFLLDAAGGWFLERPPERIVFMGGLSLICLLRFGYLKKWTENMTLGFAQMIESAGGPPICRSAAPDCGRSGDRDMDNERFSPS